MNKDFNTNNVFRDIIILDLKIRRGELMLAVMVNVVAIIVGGSIGLMLKERISENISSVIMQGIGLSVLVIGMVSAVATESPIVLILSMVSGGVIGTLLQIDNKLELVGTVVEEKLSHRKGFAKGFVMGSLLYCVGSMAIVGSLQAGADGDNTMLFVKSILDGVTAIVFAATLGYGIIFSAVPVFIIQGTIVLLSKWLAPLMTASLTNEINAVGGVLVIGIGLNILEIKKFRLGDMLPSIFMPILWLWVFSLLGV